MVGNSTSNQKVKFDVYDSTIRGKRAQRQRQDGIQQSEQKCDFLQSAHGGENVAL